MLKRANIYVFNKKVARKFNAIDLITIFAARFSVNAKNSTHGKTKTLAL